MDYGKLALLLQSLEGAFRTKSASPGSLSSVSRVRIRGTHNLQYFALSNATKGEELPVVVAVGANYTQTKTKIPDQTPRSSTLSPPHLVEDRVNNFERAYIDAYNSDPGLWKDAALASRTLGAPILKDQPYHLVMTNLSPWITTYSWGTIASVDGRNVTADLLVSSPYPSSPGRGPFEHVLELAERLKREESPVVWIGHGMHSVWEHFRALMHRLEIDQWMLTGNLGYPFSNRFLERPERFARAYREATRVSKDDILDLPE